MQYDRSLWMFIFCIYLGACGHGTAKAAKHANKETGLEYAFSKAM